MSYCTVCGNGTEKFDRSRIKGERCEGCGTRRVSLATEYFKATAPKPLDLAAIETCVRHAEHESDCQLEMPAIEAPGPRICTCIVSDAEDMLRYLLARLMTWTMDVPKVPGPYWCRGNYGPTPGEKFVVRIQAHPDGAITMSDCRGRTNVIHERDRNREFAGPIPEPIEPPHQGEAT